MEFEYTDAIYVSEADFMEMCDKVRNGMDAQDVLDSWACGLDDGDYYAVGHVESAILEAIRKEVEGE